MTLTPINAERLHCAKVYIAAMDEAIQDTNPNGVDLDTPWNWLVYSCNGSQAEAEVHAGAVLDRVNAFLHSRAS